MDASGFARRPFLFSPTSKNERKTEPAGWKVRVILSKMHICAEFASVHRRER